MKIEVLFPEICNLYGDLMNVRYLKESVPELEIIETRLTDEPCFVSEKPDLIFMGSMTENSQLLVINKLRQYKDRIIELIDGNCNFLISGNAVEIFGKEIFEDDSRVTEGLGIIDIVARRSSNNRFNSLYVGDFQADDKLIKIVGFKSVFGYAYGEGCESNLFSTVLGYGTNPEIKKEGICINNFIASYVIGPLLILNPLFTEYLMKKLFNCDPKPAYYEDAMNAYNSRLEEYLTPGKGWTY